MENTISISLSPMQVLLSLAFQVWMIIFPVIIIKKLNYLIGLLQEHHGTDNEVS